MQHRRFKRRHDYPWRPPEGFRSDWHGKRRKIFFRFVGVIALGVVFFLLGMAGLAFLLTNLFGGTGQATALVWVLGCGMSVAFPLLVGLIAMRSFRSMFDPLAKVMAAADAVAEGDFSVRVPERGTGEFGRLTRSFNRMVSELERADLQRRNLTGCTRRMTSRSSAFWGKRSSWRAWWKTCTRCP